MKLLSSKKQLQDLLDRARSVVRLSRREFIEGVLTEAVDGVQALGELDFAKLCRQRALPEPSRQVVRRRPSGRAYLDVAWEALGIVATCMRRRSCSGS